MANTTILEKLGGELPPPQVVPTALGLDNPIEEVAISGPQIQDACKSDLDFLSAFSMPTVFTFMFPPVFKAVWQWLLDFAHQGRVFPQLALGLPRGFGKTTLIKIFILYCILFTRRKFILIVSATMPLAENIISDIMDMLDEHNVIKVFGDWKLGVEKDTVKLKKFGYRGRNITLAAMGANGNVRGLNLKHERPDVMLFDDIQSREVADSEILSTALELWMIGTAMKAKSPKGCMFLFVANMYPTKFSILRKLKSNPTWTKFITGGIQSDGSSLWEELQPIKQLLKEFENDLAMGHPEIFFSEVLNDEKVSANTLIDLSKLPVCPYEDGDFAAGKFIIIDPATDKLGSDAVSVGYFEVHDSFPIMMEVVEDRLSPGDTIRVALDMALRNNCHLIAVEANAYQYTLLYWFNQIMEQLGLVGIEAVPIYSGIKNKNARILTMFKSYAAGELFIHPAARLATHTQITDFNPLRKDNTDGILDLLTYAAKVLTEFVEFIITQNILEAQSFSEIEVIEHNSPF